MDFEKDLGDEVVMRASALSDGTSITEYYDESDYVSSVEHCTPFPSLTLSKKFELERYIHNGVIVSTFSNANIVEPEIVKPESVTQESVKQDSVTPESQQENENIGCCLLL